MSLYPFPANVFRVFPPSDIEVLTRDASGNPTTICLTTHTVGDRAIAQVLLEGCTDSFVLSDGTRYFADGTVVPCNPARPASIAELHQAFDVETVGFTWPGPRPRVYIFTHTLQEWEDAKAAVRHLVAQKLLSPRSYIEGDYTGEDQGLSAQNLDATPHSAGLVALFREAAYCVQNDLSEKDGYDEEDEEWQDEQDEEDVWEEKDNDTWEEEPGAADEEENEQQACRENLDEESVDGTTAGAEEAGASIGTLVPPRSRTRTWLTRVLDWRQAFQHYAPRIVVCQRCHTHCHTGVERAERLCSFHLYACGLGTQMEAAQYRLVTLLTCRVTALQAHADSPSC